MEILFVALFMLFILLVDIGMGWTSGDCWSDAGPIKTIIALSMQLTGLIILVQALSEDYRNTIKIMAFLLAFGISFIGPWILLPKKSNKAAV